MPDFVETVVNECSNAEFRKMFGMKRITASRLIDEYCISNQSADDVAAHKEMLTFLYFMKHTIPLQELAKKFGISKTLVKTVVDKVATWLCSESHKYIQWIHPHDIPRQLARIRYICDLPLTIAAMGVLNFPIKPPRRDNQNYFNRQGYYSVQLQVVVDGFNRIVDVSDEPGSMYEQIVLARSELCRKATENRDAMFPNGTIMLSNRCDYELKRPWLMCPVRDYERHCPMYQEYNNLLYFTTEMIQRVFDDMTGRLERLNDLQEVPNVEMSRKVAICGCILHNICLMLDDDKRERDETDKRIVPVIKTYRDLDFGNALEKEGGIVGKFRRPKFIKVYIEACSSNKVYTEKALRLFEMLKMLVYERRFLLLFNKLRRRPRRGAFEVHICAEESTEMILLWSALKKGPPLKDKFPNLTVLLPTVAKVLGPRGIRYHRTLNKIIE